MKFTAFSLTAFAALATTASATSCTTNLAPYVLPYTVTASGVGDIPGICGGLWDNLNHFSSCVASNTYCGGSDGNLKWQFTVSLLCNGGMVESAWWEATKNQFGSISC